jgi:hypothetical protein
MNGGVDVVSSVDMIHAELVFWALSWSVGLTLSMKVAFLYWSKSSLETTLATKGSVGGFTAFQSRLFTVAAAILMVGFGCGSLSFKRFVYKMNYAKSRAALIGIKVSLQK